MPEFTEAAGLVDWMHDEYLSELLLRKASPEPGAPGSTKPPKHGVVTIELGLVIPDKATKLASYLLRAEGTTTWTIDGEWDKHAELELRSITDGEHGIVFDMRAPGRIALVCERVSIEPGPMRRYSPPARPDTTTLLVWGERPVSWTELWGWLAPDADLQLFRQRRGGHSLVSPDDRERVVVAPCFEMFRVQWLADDDRPSIFVSWMLGVGRSGHYFSVTRDQLRDHGQWSRALRLPEHLGPCEVMSGGIRTTGEVWLRDWVPVIEAQLAAGPLEPPVYKRAADDE